MPGIVTKLAENALINLYFAEADLIGEGEVSPACEQILQHIREAEFSLTALASFADGVGEPALGPAESDVKRRSVKFKPWSRAAARSRTNHMARRKAFSQ